MVTKRPDDFALNARPDYRIKIIRSDKTAPDKFQRPGDHSRILRAAYREREKTGKPAVLSGRKYGQRASAGKVFPPREQPFMSEEDAFGAAGFK
jgi:hypothetical protein